MRNISLIFLLLMLGPGLVGPGMAQQQGAGRSLLPDIDPRDIEIKSEFKANFKGLSRQPILGFRPQPRLYQIDPDRKPFIESQEDRMAHLPFVELSRPDPPEMSFFSYPDDGLIFSESGYGSFRSPVADWYAAKSLSERSIATARIQHHSSAGHLTGDYGAFRDFSADVGYRSSLEGSGVLEVSANVESNFNNLFPSNAGSTVQTRNEFGGTGMQVEYSDYKNDLNGWRLAGRYNGFDAHSTVGWIENTYRIHTGEMKFEHQWTGERLHEIYRLKGIAQYGSWSSGAPAARNWYRFGAETGYERLLEHSTLLTSRLGFQVTRDSDGNRHLYPVFTLKARHWVNSSFTINGQVGGKVSNRSFDERYRDNPFLLALQPQFAHTYKLGGTVQLNYQPWNRTLIELDLGYHDIQNYAFYANGSRVADALASYNAAPLVSSFYKTFYADARMGTVRLTATHDLNPGTFWIHVSGFYRYHRLNEATSRPIPYLADYGVRSTIFLRPIPKLRIKLSGEYVGPRRNADNSRKLKQYFLAGTRFEFRINDHFGVYLQGKNVLDQTYRVWEGYVARPLQLYGGVTVSL